MDMAAQLFERNMVTEQGIRGKVINTLRILCLDKSLHEQTVFIPDGCEEYGFSEGHYQVADLLVFLADMLEE